MEDNKKSSTATDEEENKANSSKKLICESILSAPLKTLGTGENTLTFHNALQPAWHCTLTIDGMYLAVCYGAPDPCIRIWKCINNKYNKYELYTELSGIQTRTIRSIQFAPIIRPLIIASASFDGTIAIWEETNNNNNNKEKEWECTAQLEGHDNEVKDIAWNSTGSLLASCGRDKTVWIWECYLSGTVGGHDNDGSDFECIAVLNGHEGDVKCVVFANNNSNDQFGDGNDILFSASYDNTIRIWVEEDSGDWYCAFVLDTVHTSTIWTLSVSSDSKNVISGSADGSIGIIQCCSINNEQQQQLVNNKEDIINNNEFRPGNKAIWKCVGNLPNAHNKDSIIYSVDYARSSTTTTGQQQQQQRIVSGGSDNKIQIYYRTSEVVTDNNEPNQSNTTTTTTTTTTTPQYVIDTSVIAPGGDVNCIMFHPIDNTILISASDDGNVRIWKYK